MMKLYSGSDIRGTAVAVDGDPISLTDGAVVDIVNAYVYWLSAKLKRDKLKVAIGHDSRISAKRILDKSLEALKSSGCQVMSCGLCSTPSMFMMTQYESTKADGAIMITASHHPFQKNGLKFFTEEGGLESKDIKDILRYASTGERIKGRAGKVVSGDYLKLYTESLVERVRQATGERRPLEGLKIVVDAGNGAGGFFVDKVLNVLGANTAGSQFLEPDGLFPNHVPNPEDKQAMGYISRSVIASKADFGIIFDTDVDRAACVDSDGSEINRNRLIALISSILLEESPGATIVTDSVTSDGLSEFIAEHKGKHHRFKRGYKNVINEAIYLNGMGIVTPLAIETSGHAAFAENYYLDDGAYLVVRILIKLCALKKERLPLMSLIKGLREAKEEGEYRIKFRSDFSATKAREIVEHVDTAAAKKLGWTVEDGYEGVRVSVKGGWFLIRMSVHDPILPVNIESDLKGGVKKTAKAIYRLLKKYKKVLVLTPLTAK